MSKDNHLPPDGGRDAYAIELALDGVDFKPFTIKDPLPLGRQILAEAKLKPVDSFSLFAIVSNGDLEDVRLDEPFDLRAKGAERFIAFTGDRVYRLTVNGREIKWGPETIPESALRLLSSATEAEAVYLDVPGGTDRLIRENESVDLTAPGVEHFILAKRPKIYKFFVNGVKYETDQRRLTGLQIKARVANWDATHDLVLEGHGDAPDRIIGDAESVDLESETGPRRFSSVPKANFG
jgi:hypothetical protein